MGQSSSQHDKFQVGNMHTYSLDLVHFHIIQSSIQSFHEQSLTQSVVLCTFLSLYMYLYTYLNLVSLGAGLKKWVLRPMGYWRGKLSGPWEILSRWENYWELISRRCQTVANGLWDFLFGLLLNPQKGSGVAKGLLSREGAHFLGWKNHVEWDTVG